MAVVTIRAHAQQVTDEAPPGSLGLSMCGKRTVERSTNPISRDLRTEWRDLLFDLCRVKEDYGEGGFQGMLERDFGTVQDLIVDVFTGRGLHPTVGGIVPQSGTGFGLALNDEWHITETPHTRFTTSVEWRRAETGFWAAGAVSHMQFDWYRAYDVGSFRMPQVTAALKHFALPEMPFYGLGNQSSRHDRSLFELTETEFPIQVDLPVAYGLTLSPHFTALYAASTPSPTFATRFSGSSVPGIRAHTTYAIPGLVASYRSPDTLYGLSGEAHVGYEAYQTLSGGRFSFDRVDARMGVHYGIPDHPTLADMFPRLWSLLSTSRFSGEANLVISEPRSHNAVPFYLQPTLGGGDIHNENWLRSYQNYRFRAPNTVAYNLTYEQRLIDPLGLFIYTQWGKVGMRPGELDFHRLKRSVGIGFTVRLGGRAIAEFSFAWGGGEGSQTYSTGNTNNAIGFGARAAGTVGLRGVF